MKKASLFALGTTMLVIASVGAYLIFTSRTEVPAAGTPKSATSSNSVTPTVTTQSPVNSEPAGASASGGQNSAASKPSQEIPPETASSGETTPESAKAKRFRAYAAIEKAEDRGTPDALKEIVSYATNQDVRIRQAALDALVRIGDASAAAMLRQAAKETNDSAAIIDMLTKADYIELPPATPESLANRIKSKPGAKSLGDTQDKAPADARPGTPRSGS